LAKSERQFLAQFLSEVAAIVGFSQSKEAFKTFNQGNRHNQLERTRDLY